MSIKQQRASLGTTHTQRKSKREEGAAAARGCCARRALFRTQNQTRNAAPPEFAKAADFVVVQSQRMRSNILLRAHTAPRAFFSARRRAALSAPCARVLACVRHCPGSSACFFAALRGRTTLLVDQISPRPKNAGTLKQLLPPFQPPPPAADAVSPCVRDTTWLRATLLRLPDARFVAELSAAPECACLAAFCVTSWRAQALLK